MTDQEGGNPLAEGIGQTARTAAELASVAMMGLAAAARIRQQRLEERLAKEKGEAEAVRAELRAAEAKARLQWTPDLETALARRAVEVWTVAEPWADTHSTAREAMVAAERRLDALNPGLMQDYRRQLAARAPRFEAMLAAVSALQDRVWHVSAAGEAVPTFVSRDAGSIRWVAAGQVPRASAPDAGDVDGDAQRPVVLAAKAYPEGPQPTTAARLHLPAGGGAAAFGSTNTNGHRHTR